MSEGVEKHRCCSRSSDSALHRLACALQQEPQDRRSDTAGRWCVCDVRPGAFTRPCPCCHARRKKRAALLMQKDSASHDHVRFIIVACCAVWLLLAVLIVMGWDRGYQTMRPL